MFTIEQNHITSNYCSIHNIQDYLSTGKQSTEAQILCEYGMYERPPLRTFFLPLRLTLTMAPSLSFCDIENRSIKIYQMHVKGKKTTLPFKNQIPYKHFYCG